MKIVEPPAENDDSSLWTNHFERCPENPNKAKCRHCQQLIDRSGSSTSNMWRHLRTKRHRHLVVRAASKRTNESNPLGTSKSNSSANKRPRTASDFASIDEALTKWLVHDHLAFQSVESQYFIEFIKKLNPDYILPSRTTVSEKLVPMLAGKVEDAIKKELTDVSHVTVTTDTWTSASTDCYEAVTCHFINRFGFVCVA